MRAAEDAGSGAGSAPRERSGRLAAVLFVFAVLSAVHVFLLPLFEGPDEHDNLHYVRFLSVEGRLTQPTVEPPEVDAELELLGRGHMPPLWFVSQVPLFRLVGADAWRFLGTPNPAFLRNRTGGETAEEVLADPSSRLHFRHGRDELVGSRAVTDVRWLRASSILWALVALVGVYAAARTVGKGALPVLATALAAFTPQLQHLSATVTMDLMLAAWGALALAASCRWCDPNDPGERALRRAAAAGAFAGLACLTKLNGLVLLPACVIAALFAWRNGKPLVRPLLAWTASLALVAGPYYVWGWVESGHPLWSWQYQKISPFHTRGIVESGVWSLSDWWVFARTLFLTWFADFGWTAVWFSALISFPVFGLLTAGGAAALVRVRSTGATSPLAFLVAAALVMLAAEVFFNWSFPQPQARHLYPFLPAFVVPVAAGLERLRLLRASVALHLVLSVVALPVLLGALRPEGWNADPRWAITDAERRPDAELVDEAAAQVAWLEPAADAILGAEASPRFRWVARPGYHYDVLIGIDNAELEHRHWDPDRTVFRARLNGFEVVDEFLFPPSLWRDGIWPGRVLTVQVLELDPETGRAVGRSAVRQVRRDA